MVRALAVLIVVDAVRLDRREWHVLAVQIRPTVLVLRLNVLQQLVDTNVWRNVLRVGAENVEQLLVNWVLTTSGSFRELILACIGIEKS